MIEMNQLIVEMLEHVVGPTRVSSGHSTSPCIFCLIIHSIRKESASPHVATWNVRPMRNKTFHRRKLVLKRFWTGLYRQQRLECLHSISIRMQMID